MIVAPPRHERKVTENSPLSAEPRDHTKTGDARIMAHPRARVVPAVVREPAWCCEDGDINSAEGVTEYAETEDDLLCLSFEGGNILLVGGTVEGRGLAQSGSR